MTVGAIPSAARWLLAGIFLLLAFVASGAEEKTAVSGVRFQLAQPPGGGPAWFETELTLQATPGGERAGNMTGRVRVIVRLGFELPEHRGVRRHAFYRSEAELVALERGQSRVRFYLPPAVVKRDMLTGAPKYWAVECAPASSEDGGAAIRFSTTLNTPDLRTKFMEKVDGEGTENDGILVPHYLTPLADAHPQDTPSFVRRAGP